MPSESVVKYTEYQCDITLFNVIYTCDITLKPLLMNQLTFYSRKKLNSITSLCKSFISRAFNFLIFSILKTRYLGK